MSSASATASASVATVGAPIDYTTLALRICAHSAEISAALAERAHIDHRFTDRIDLRSVWPPRAQHESLTVTEQTQCWAELDRLDAELDAMCRYTGSNSGSGGDAATATSNNPTSISSLAAAMSDMNLAATAAGSNCSANITTTTTAAGSNRQQAVGSRAGRVGGVVNRQNSLRRQNSVQASMLGLNQQQSVDESGFGELPKDESLLDEPLVTLEEVHAFNATAPTLHSNAEDDEHDYDLQVRPLHKSGSETIRL